MYIIYIKNLQNAWNNGTIGTKHIKKRWFFKVFSCSKTFINKWNTYKTNGTQWNNWNKRSATATFLTCKTRKNAKQPHTRQACDCFFCFPCVTLARNTPHDRILIPRPERGGYCFIVNLILRYKNQLKNPFYTILRIFIGSA